MQETSEREGKGTWSVYAKQLLFSHTEGTFSTKSEGDGQEAVRTVRV